MLIVSKDISISLHWPKFKFMGSSSFCCLELRRCLMLLLLCSICSPINGLLPESSSLLKRSLYVLHVCFLPSKFRHFPNIGLTQAQVILGTSFSSDVGLYKNIKKWGGRIKISYDQNNQYAIIFAEIYKYLNTLIFVFSWV